jgi:hypothetical protein
MIQLGECEITDPTTRPAYRYDDSRHFVLDDDDEPVYGVWLHPDEYSESMVLSLPEG